MTPAEAKAYHRLRDLLREAVRNAACWIPRAMDELAKPPVVEPAAEGPVP